MAFVFYSSAVLTFLLEEPEADQVADALYQVKAGRERLLMPFMTLMEVRYRLLRDYPSVAEMSMALISSWPSQTYESTPEWRERAARIKAGAGLSMGDAWIAALALMHDATLVHKDKEFDRVASLRSLHLGRARAK
jgi:predicted nucleic acid-binding protein